VPRSENDNVKTDETMLLFMDDDIDPITQYKKKRNQYQSTGGLDLEVIESFALQNARDHNGTASTGSVMGSTVQYYKKKNVNIKPGEISINVKRIVSDLNEIPYEFQKQYLDEIGFKTLEKRERRTGLPELENVEKGQIVMRFAPGPSGPLHLGHTRAAILNDEFCKRYDGKFILRLEDTNPEKIDPEAYRMIPEDLDWLGIKVDKTYVQSDRFEEYYQVARELITKGAAYVCTIDTEIWKKGAAYVCTIDTEIWKELKYAGKPCEERDLDVNIHLDKWEKMLDGTFAEGEAFLVIKTDLEHKNPAVRDFVGMRIRDAPHPRTNDRYRAYPLYNLSVAIDDHLMGCTHILRGKDHLNNTFRQEYIYRHLGWNEPKFIHYGLVSIPDTILKTSLIKEKIAEGKYSGWGDVRLGTVKALKARGFDPKALRDYWIDVGMKSAEIQFSWDNFYSMNRSLIDPLTKRYFFVPEPKMISFVHDCTLNARVPVHPEVPEMGTRSYEVKPQNGSIRLMVPSEDLLESQVGGLMRLKDLCNIRISNIGSGQAEFAGHDIDEIRRTKGRIVQWVQEDGVRMDLVMPDGAVVRGIAEKNIIEAAEKGENVQFERVGYFRTLIDGGIKANFMHP
jgi:glutamyl-tRNA synthetase